MYTAAASRCDHRPAPSDTAGVNGHAPGFVADPTIITTGRIRAPISAVTSAAAETAAIMAPG